MKTYIVILVIAMSLFSLNAQAQGNKKRVTGPKAKNMKAKDRLSHVRKSEIVETEKITGPEAKNMKPSERLEEVEKTQIQKREVLKGPKAKNKKHFRK